MSMINQPPNPRWNAAVSDPKGTIDSQGGRWNRLKVTGDRSFLGRVFTYVGAAVLLIGLITLILTWT